MSTVVVDFWEDLRARRGRWDVLAHPFYQRWTRGELTDRELAIYASEYDHAVVAIARASRRVALEGGELSRHADEEEAHVGLWRDFAKATGWGCASAWFYAEDPRPQTEELSQVWSGDSERGLAEDLVTLYAIESSQTEISTVKLAGLLDHYRFEEGPATEYFRLHAELDAHHAALMRERLEPLLPTADDERLLDQAEAVHRAYWHLLDGVVELADN